MRDGLPNSLESESTPATCEIQAACAKRSPKCLEARPTQERLTLPAIAKFLLADMWFHLLQPGQHWEPEGEGKIIRKSFSVLQACARCQPLEAPRPHPHQAPRHQPYQAHASRGCRPRFRLPALASEGRFPAMMCETCVNELSAGGLPQCIPAVTTATTDICAMAFKHGTCVIDITCS